MQRYDNFCNNYHFLLKNRVKTHSRLSFRTNQTNFTTSQSVFRNALPSFNLGYLHPSFSIVIRHRDG